MYELLEERKNPFNHIILPSPLINPKYAIVYLYV